MKVSLLIYGSLSSLSGGYLYDRKLVEALWRCGDRVELVSLPWRNYARHLADNLSPALVQRLKLLRSDVLVQDELNHPSLFHLNRRLKGQLAYPIVSIVHHLLSNERHPGFAGTLQNRLYTRVERLYLESVDGFVFNSRTTKKDVEALLGSPRPGIVAAPAADHLDPQTDDDEIARRSRETPPLRLLFVGNLIPRKGLHTLLEAFASLPSGRFTLDVVGDPDADPAYAASIRRRVKALGPDAPVILHGALDEAGLKDRLCQAHVLVLPSSYEGFGIAYLEAMGFGLPCIGTTSGAAGEVIQDGQTGFLVPPEDPAAVLIAVQRLASDPGLLLRMSLAARQTYQAHPTWAQSGEKIRGFLQSLVASWGRRGS